MRLSSDGALHIYIYSTGVSNVETETLVTYTPWPGRRLAEVTHKLNGSETKGKTIENTIPAPNSQPDTTDNRSCGMVSL